MFIKGTHKAQKAVTGKEHLKKTKQKILHFKATDPHRIS